MKRRSVTFVAPYAVEVVEEPLPALPPGRVLVQTLVSAVSAGTEMLFYRGLAPGDVAVDETLSALAGPLSYPIKYGYAAVGRVVDRAADVTAGWLGRLVFAFNPHEDYFVADPAGLHPLPEHMTPDTAVFLPNMETAVSLLMDGRPVIGEQVAVFGQGVVGLLTTALLARLPPAVLATFDPYPLRRERSLALGAGAAFDPFDSAALEDARRLFARDEDYAGADLCYELSGEPRALEQAIAVAGYGGRIVIGSWYGQKRAELALGGRFHRAHLRLISTQVSRLAPEWLGRWTKGRRLAVAWEMLARLQPEGLINHRLPIGRAAEVYDLLDRRAAEALQVVFVYD